MVPTSKMQLVNLSACLQYGFLATSKPQNFLNKTHSISVLQINHTGMG